MSQNWHHFPPGLGGLWLTLSGSKYLPMSISMVPKKFEPLKFDCNIIQMSRDTAFPTRLYVCTAKTQINIRTYTF